MNDRAHRHIFVEETNSFINTGMSIGRNANSQEIILSRPNMIAIYLSIVDKNFESAESQWDAFASKLSKNPEGNLGAHSPECTEIGFDFIESLCTATVFAYFAAEAFANSIIPDDYSDITINTNNGERKTIDKGWIERQEKTTEKYKKHIPKIYGIKSPATQSFWTDFTRLEKLRNGLVHYKANEKLYNNQEKGFIQELFLCSFRHEPQLSSRKLIKYITDNINEDIASLPREFCNNAFRVESYNDLTPRPYNRD